MRRGKSARSLPAERQIRRTDAELARQLQEAIATLSDLCGLYDQGHIHTTAAIANQINLILIESKFAIRARDTRRFATIDRNDSARSLSTFHKLIFTSVSNKEPVLRFMPSYLLKDPKLMMLSFVEWWNRDVIFRASVAKPGAPPGAIPLYLEDQLPFEQRRKLCRRELIMTIRDRFGAHVDPMVPETLAEVQRAEMSGFSIQVTWPSGENFNTWEETLPVAIGPMPAMVRQVAHEVLQAYEAQ